jgi:hypothetical protein
MKNLPLVALGLVAAAALAGCETSTAVMTSSAAASTSCKNKSPNVVIGSPPVVTYWCDAPSGSAYDLQFDVYVGSTRNGPYFRNCSSPDVPQPVKDALC